MSLPEPAQASAPVTDLGDEAPEQQAPVDAALAEACRTLVDAVVRTLKTVRLYSADNPVHAQALETIGVRLADHVAEHGSLTLGVDRNRLHLSDILLYEDEVERDGLCARLHGDGVRAIHFNDGIRAPEGAKAVILLAQGTAADAAYLDDDLVTLFWEAALPHVCLTAVAEDPPLPALESSIPPLDADALAELTGTVSAAQTPTLPPPVQLGQKVLEVFRLGDNDLAYIDELIYQEETLDPHLALLSTMIDVLSIEENQDDFVEMMGRYEQFLHEFLTIGRFDLAAAQVAGLNSLKTQQPKLSTAMTGVLDEALANLGTPASIAVLGGGVRVVFVADADGAEGQHSGNATGAGQDKQADDKTRNDAGESSALTDLKHYLATLKNGDAGAMLRVAVGVPDGEVRHLLVQAATRFCADTGALHLLPLLADDDLPLVCCAIEVIGRVGQVSDLGDLAPLSDHLEVSVRRAALDAIARIAPKGHAMILPFLRDPETAVRGRALAAVTSAKFKDAINVLQGIVGGSLFADMRMGERRALFAAIGRLAKNDALDFFAPFLVRRTRLWGKRKGENDALCAVSGVKAICTPAAKEALKTACKHHNERVQAAAKYALHELG